VVAILLAVRGAIGFFRIRKPGDEVAAARCPAGQLAGAPAAIADAPRVAASRSARSQRSASLIGDAEPLAHVRPAVGSRAVAIRHI
jgi:hypothetical protein